MELTFAQQLQQFVANHTIMVIAWVAILIAVLYSFYKGATSKVKSIDHVETTRLLNSENGVVLDVRSNDEFKAGRIIGAVNVLPSDIKAQKANAIEKYKSQPVVVVDANGLTSNASAEALFKQGFEKVYVLKEGMAGWRAANLPTVKK